MAELGGGLCFPAGFLEKNRDVLSKDILALVRSSQNKFLREIFGLESSELKRGRGTIVRVTAGSQLFKVGSVALPSPGPGVWGWGFSGGAGQRWLKTGGGASGAAGGVGRGQGNGTPPAS